MLKWLFGMVWPNSTATKLEKDMTANAVENIRFPIKHLLKSIHEPDIEWISFFNLTISHDLTRSVFINLDLRNFLSFLQMRFLFPWVSSWFVEYLILALYPSAYSNSDGTSVCWMNESLASNCHSFLCLQFLWYNPSPVLRIHQMVLPVYHYAY